MEAQEPWIVDPAALPVALFRVDAEGAVLEANPAARRLLGVAVVPGERLSDFFLQPEAVARTLREGGAADAGVRTDRGLLAVRILATATAPHLVLVVVEPAASGSVLARLNHKVSQPLMAAMGPLEMMLLSNELTSAQHELVARAYEQLARASEMLQAAAYGDPK